MPLPPPPSGRQEFPSITFHLTRVFWEWNEATATDAIADVGVLLLLFLPAMIGITGGVRLPVDAAEDDADEQEDERPAPAPAPPPPPRCEVLACCCCCCDGVPGLRLARLFRRWMRLNRFLTSL